MFRWAGGLRVSLILVVLLAAIVVPVVASGYIDARRAAMADVQGDYASAAQYYRSAAIKLPWRTGFWEQAAAAQVRAGNRDAAVSIYESLRQRGILSAYGWQFLGAVQCASGDCRAALDTWFAGLKAHPSDTRFYALISEGFGQLGDRASQRMWLERWVVTGQASASDHFGLGVLLLTTDLSRSRSELAKAASMDDNFGSAVSTLNATLDLAAGEANPSRRLVILGRGLGLVNNWPLAGEAFIEAARLDPNNAEAWAWMGEADQQAGGDGEGPLNIALYLGPDDAIVHGLRGLYWKRQGKPKAALAEYQAAAELEPKNADWQAALGDAYTSAGDLVSALAAYQSATSLAPENATYWRLLALFSADNSVQVLDIGLPAAKKAAEIAPNDAQVLDALGWTYSQAGLLTTAEQTLNKVIEIAPNVASVHLHLAETYLREGNLGFAKIELQRAVSIDPNGPYGTFAAQLLKQYFP